MHNPPTTGTADTIHSIVFSLLLLNTDLHVTSSKQHKKMTRKEYITNTGLGICGNLLSWSQIQKEWDAELKSMYDSVKSTPLPVDSSRVGAKKPLAGDPLLPHLSPPSIILFSAPLVRKNLTRGYSKAKNRRFFL